MISLPWGKVTHLIPWNVQKILHCIHVATSYPSGHYFFIPVVYLGAIHKVTHFLRRLINLLLNHANWKHNKTIRILGAENSLWHSTHFEVCTLSSGVCCQEDYSRLGFWYVLQPAVSRWCCSICGVSWLVLTISFVEPEICNSEILGDRGPQMGEGNIFVKGTL